MKKNSYKKLVEFIIIIICMYLGRIGPISMVIFFNKERKYDLVSFPHEDINVG